MQCTKGFGWWLHAARLLLFIWLLLHLWPATSKCLILLVGSLSINISILNFNIWFQGKLNVSCSFKLMLNAPHYSWLTATFLVMLLRVHSALELLGVRTNTVFAIGNFNCIRNSTFCCQLCFRVDQPDQLRCECDKWAAFRCQTTSLVVTVLLWLASSPLHWAVAYFNS